MFDGIPKSQGFQGRVGGIEVIILLTKLKNEKPVFSHLRRWQCPHRLYKCLRPARPPRGRRQKQPQSPRPYPIITSAKFLYPQSANPQIDDGNWTIKNED